MPMNNDAEIVDLMYKYGYEDQPEDPAYNRASREYKWTLMAENIFNENPIQFYSEQMRRLYCPP